MTCAFLGLFKGGTEQVEEGSEGKTSTAVDILPSFRPPETTNPTENAEGY